MQFFYLIFFLFFSFCCSKQKDFKEDFSLSEKIKDMIIVSVRNNDLEYLLKENFANGYIIFAKDFLTGAAREAFDEKTLTETIAKLKKNEIKIISVDNEGGAVNRLGLLQNFASIPAMKYMKYIPEKELFEDLDDTCKKMADLGINVNFTPIVDLQINKDRDFFMNYKKRLASNDPNVVIKLAKNIITAHRKNNIKTSLKHFPGHGSATENSHDGFVDISKTWQKKELIPYQKLLKDRFVDSIMISHVYNKNIDDKYPASMSKKTIDILRKDMNYNGVIFSDSIDMNALMNKYSLEEIVINVVNAGTDVIIFANQINYDKDIAKKIYNIIFNAVIKGKISRERIEESSKRINEFLNK